MSAAREEFRIKAQTYRDDVLGLTFQFSVVNNRPRMIVWRHGTSVARNGARDVDWDEAGEVVVGGGLGMVPHCRFSPLPPGERS